MSVGAVALYVLVFLSCTRQLNAFTGTVTGLYETLLGSYSIPDGSVYDCPDAAHANDAVDDFRSAFGYSTVLWDADLVNASKVAMVEAADICQRDVIVNSTSTPSSLGVGYITRRRASFKCSHAVHYWYSKGMQLMALDLENSTGATIDEIDGQELAGYYMLMWKQATRIGCAVKDCDQQKQAGTGFSEEYAVFCYMSSDGNVPKVEDMAVDMIRSNLPTTADLKGSCEPQVHITDRRESVEMIVEQYEDSHNLTAERLVCFHGQLSLTDIKVTGVPLAIPCADETVPQTCMEWEMMVPLSTDAESQAAVVSPTVFIANPNINSLDQIAELYNYNLKDDSLDMIKRDLCCYNPWFRTEGSDQCGTIAPLQNVNSYVMIPPPEDIQFRNCDANTTERYQQVRDVYECPDKADAAKARSAIRGYRGLKPVQWDETLEAAITEEVNYWFDYVCANATNGFMFLRPEGKPESPYANFVNNTFSVTRMGGALTGTTCAGPAMGFDLAAQRLPDYLAQYLPWDVVYADDNPTLYAYTAMTNRSTKFGCVLQVCDMWYSNLVCLYDVTDKQLQEELRSFNSTKWYEVLPQSQEACPEPYWPVPDDTYETIAAAKNLTVQEIMCFHNQARSPHDAKIRWSQAEPLAIPCPSDNPGEVTCEVYELYKGTCGVTYTAHQGDSFDRIATFKSAKQQGLTGCEICLFNNRTSGEDCDLQIFDEVIIPCSSDVSDDIRQLCSGGGKYAVFVHLDIMLNGTMDMMYAYQVLDSVEVALYQTMMDTQSGMVHITSDNIDEVLQALYARLLLEGTGQVITLDATAESNAVTPSEMRERLADAISTGTLMDSLADNGIPAGSVQGQAVEPEVPAPAPAPSDATVNGSTTSGGGLSAGAIGAIVAGSAVAVLVAVVGGWVFYKKHKTAAPYASISQFIEAHEKDYDTKEGGRKRDGPPLESIYMSQLISISGADTISDHKHHSVSTNPNSTLSTATNTSEKSCVIKPKDLRFDRTKEKKFVKLGEGAFSKIYRGEYQGTPVAVKVLHHTAQHQSSISSMLREIAVLRNCEHANIVQFLGATFIGDEVMMVFELMEEGNLFNALQGPHGNTFLWGERGAEIAYEFAKGLEHLHNMRVVHCDLKSPNILLGSGTAKIGDMGMSKYLSKDYVTKGGDLGSYAWAAPELLLNKHITEKVDIYSMGVILWEIVTGEPPQRGCLRDVNVSEECPQDIADLIQRCTEIEPTDRPTATEIRQILKKFAATE